MNLDRYEKYVDSGVDWLGEIPKRWKVKRVKDVIKINPQTSKIVSDTIARIEFLPMTNVNEEHGVVKQFRLVDYKKVKQGYTAFKNKDVLFAKITPCMENGNCVVINNLKSNLGFGSTEFIVIRPGRKLNSDFVHSFFRNTRFLKKAEKFMTGAAGQRRISTDYIRCHEFSVPPFSEQKEIAKYLDAKTGAIDKKVLLLEEKILKYQELRKSLINETVCRGLDKDVELRDSGITWIGSIPSHWLVKRLKDFILFSKGVNASKYNQHYIRDAKNIGNYPVYSGQTENDGLMAMINSFEYNFKNNILLVTTVGAQAMKLKIVGGKFTLSQNCALMELKSINNQNCNFIFYFLICLFREEREKIPTIMQPSLRIEDLKQYFSVLPPFQEQQSIAKYLDEKTEQIDSIVSNIKIQILRLKELRKTLINDLVTGQIRVCEN